MINFNQIEQNKNLRLEKNGEFYQLEILSEKVGTRFVHKYVLTKNAEPVASTLLFYTQNNSLEQLALWHAFGYREVPESMFEIDKLYVEKKYRGIGTTFLNLIMQDIIEFDKTFKLNSKIVFVRLNTPEATAFFNKWNAKVNDIFERDSAKTTKMIIDEPKVIKAETLRLVSLA